jgi:serine/threonine protein kinase
MHQQTNAMALFDIDEVVRGQRLGAGAFSHVDQIDAFLPRQDGDDQVIISADDHATREHFANTTTNENGAPRFAIKIIQPSMMNDENDFRTAAGGLANEADILSKLDHPHIIKLRGFPADGVRAYVRTERYDGYFLILDRLNETLTERIQLWKRETKRLRNPVFVWKQSGRRQELLLERLNIALDIASALAYLHSKRIIYRDLKSDNIGFDDAGRLKLFDFGLSRSLPRTGDDLAGSFEMSGKVGTKAYMAPEVYERQPYNTKADVYSYAMLLWEILALQRPFAQHTKQMYRIRVVKNGERPTIDKSWPVEIQTLLRRAWSRDVNARPTMHQVCEILTKLTGMMSPVGRGGAKQEIIPRRVVPSAA